jgi:hypothetical protein
MFPHVFIDSPAALHPALFLLRLTVRGAEGAQSPRRPNFRKG